MDEHAYCPHCRALLLERAPHPFPARPVRCAACHLLVGPGRSRDVDGRARRPVAAAAPADDAVLTVLQDLQGQARDVAVQGITSEFPALGGPVAGGDPDAPLVGA